MYTAGELERASMALDKPMRGLEMRIMSDIVRRIRENGEITRAADWQIDRLVQLGYGMEEIESAIQQALGASDEIMDDLYSKVIASGYARDAALYKAAGKVQIPFEENAPLQQLISSVTAQTNETMQNITQSLGFAQRGADGRISFTPIADYYQKTLDNAMYDISSGAFDYNTVLKRVVREMTDSGLRTVDYASGHSNRVDVAARRAVMTGMSQLTAKVNEDNMQALDTDYVEVSWHSGARPEHQVWQGKIFRWNKSASPPEKKPDKPENDNDRSIDISAKSGIIKSGAVSGGLIPDSDEAQAHAERYYESVRKMKTDVRNIAQNTGFSEEEISQIKNHVFINEHDLGGEVPERFYPNYAMSQSWQRLIDGKNIQKHDLTLLNHEKMESNLMKQGYSQKEAHELAEKVYNYAKESREYYAEIKKHSDRANKNRS